MWSHTSLLFTVNFVLLTLCAGKSSDCAKDVDDFYVCVKTKYDAEIEKLLDEGKKTAFAEEAAKCFTSNGCTVPKQGGEAANDSPVEEEDDDVDITMGFEAIHVKKVLNPSWFPGETNKNVSAKQEECASLQDEKAIELVNQCVQKSLPGFKFPYDNGLPTKVDYMAQTSDAFGSMDDFFNGVAENYLAALRDRKACPEDKGKRAQACLEKLFREKQMNSFDRTLATERIFRFLCNVGAECHKAAREPCRQWILKIGTLTCECASAEENNVVEALSENYAKCFGVQPNKEEIRKTFKSLAKRKCKAMEDDAKQCSSVLHQA